MKDNVQHGLRPKKADADKNFHFRRKKRETVILGTEGSEKEWPYTDTNLGIR